MFEHIDASFICTGICIYVFMQKWGGLGLEVATSTPLNIRKLKKMMNQLKQNTKQQKKRKNREMVIHV